MPDIVRAAASPFEHVGQFTVLNGAAGVTSALAEIIQEAGALASVARNTITPLLSGDSSRSGSNGNATRPAASAARPVKAAKVVPAPSDPPQDAPKAE
jgi:hypothetical protein